MEIAKAKHSKTITQPHQNDITNVIIPNKKRWVKDTEDKGNLTKIPFIKKTVSSYTEPMITFDDGSSTHVNYTFPITNKDTIDEADMLSIKSINNADVINNLNNRFRKQKPFTNIGDTLISMFPNNKRSNEYKEEVIELLLNVKNEREYPAHLYSNVFRAIKALMTPPHYQSQVIIFHGEESSNKTEALDQALRCITYYFNSKDRELIGMQIRNMNIVLEAFGNAKTEYNDNSLRFGKFIKVYIDSSMNAIESAQISILHLDKTRIINLHDAFSERNYHIFYYLIIGCDYNYLNSLGLTNDCSDYSYLKQSNIASYNTSDFKAKYKEVISCLKSLEFTQEDIEGIVKVLGVILLLGNIEIEIGINDNSMTPFGQEEAFVNISKLLGVNQYYFQMVLTKRPPAFGSKEYGALYNAADIKTNIDSLAQVLYQKLFEWVVKKINNKLRYKHKPSSSIVSEVKEKHFIGLVDFCGFQHSHHRSNSVDQLCINYINEQIHQMYLKHCFEKDTAEYKKEGLKEYLNELTVPYRSNINVIKQLKSFFNQTSTAQRDDQVHSIAQSFKNEVMHSNDLNNQRRNTLIVRHSHEDIEYSTEDYVKNNNRDISQGVVDCILASRDQIMQFICTNSLSEMENKEAKGRIFKERLKPDSKKRIQKGIIAQCILQLKELKREIKKSNQHYALFIKPNKANRETNEEINIWPNYVNHQIQYLSIPSLIDVKSNRHFISYSYEQFVLNNQLVLDKGYSDYTIANYDKATQLIIERVMEGDDTSFYSNDCLFGKSKLFMKGKFNKTFNVKMNKVLNQKQLNCNIIKCGIYHLLQREKFRDKCLYVKYLQGVFIASNKKRILKKKIQNIELIQAAYKEYIAYKEFQFYQLQYNNIQKGFNVMLAKKAIETIDYRSHLITIRLGVYKKHLKEKQRSLMRLILYEIIEDAIKEIESNEYSAICKAITPFLQMYFIQKQHRRIMNKAKAQLRIEKQRSVVSLFQERNVLFKIKQHRSSALFIALLSQTIIHQRYYSAMRYNSMIIQAYLKCEHNKDSRLNKITDEYFKSEEPIMAAKIANDYKLLFPNAIVPLPTTQSNCDSFFADSKLNEFTEQQIKCVSSTSNLNKSRSHYDQGNLFHSPSFSNAKPKLQLFSAILDYDIINNNNEAYVNWAKEYLYYHEVGLKCNTPLMVIQAGNTHTLALDNKGKVFAWGWNNYGQCGKTIKESIFTQIQSTISENEDAMMNSVPVPYYQSIGSHIAKSVIGQCNQVIAGEEYSICLSTNGNVYSFGNNTKGQLGLGNRKPSNTGPIQINKINGELLVIKGIYSSSSFNVLLTEDNKLLAWYISDNKMAIKPMRLFIDKKVVIKQIACGKGFMIVLSTNGLVYGSGTNTHGELGLEDNSERMIPEEISSINSFNETIIQIRCGYKHVAALSDNGKAYAWGNNSYGQIGNEDTIDNSLAVIQLPYKQNVIQVACGYRCTIFLTQSRKMYFTGRLSKENYSLTPMLFDMNNKSIEYCNKSYAPVRILASWNQSFSIFYATIANLHQVNQRIKDSVIEDIIKSLAIQWLDDSVNAPYLSQYSNVIE